MLEKIIDQFGKKKAKEIYDRIEKVLEGISKMPRMYPSSRKQKNLRKCVFSKQTSIYYRIDQDYIEIVSFRENRKDPGKFKV